MASSRSNCQCVVGDKFENADNYLKVIFNALNQVLEPDRKKEEPYFFIEREQDRYRLNPLQGLSSTQIYLSMRFQKEQNSHFKGQSICIAYSAGIMSRSI